MTETKRMGMAFLEGYRRYTEKLAYMDEQMFFINRMIATAKSNFGEKDMRYVTLLKERQELSFRRACCAGAREVIDQTVKRLPSPERQVIERYYVHGDGHRAAEELMEQLGFEKTHIYRLRDRALMRIGEIVADEQLDVTLTLLRET